MNLIACSTLEIVHVPVSCLGQPSINWGFSHEDADSMTKEAREKIKRGVAVLRARIDSQCKINQSHNKLHESQGVTK